MKTLLSLLFLGILVLAAPCRLSADDKQSTGDRTDAVPGFQQYIAQVHVEPARPVLNNEVTPKVNQPGEPSPGPDTKPAKGDDKPGNSKDKKAESKQSWLFLAGSDVY